jgi:hypothetical protein
VNNGLSSTDIAALAINSAGDVFAGTRSQFGVGGGIFRSTDNGATWTEQDTGLTAIDLNSVAIDAAGRIFVGALGGAFVSSDNADSWEDISSGLIPAGGNVWTITIDDEGLLAGTAGGGVFRHSNTTSGTCPRPVTQWREKPGAWPVDVLILGNQTYNKDELLRLLKTKVGPEEKADASLIAAHQLIAVKLNLANGADSKPVQATIEDADALLGRFPGKLPYRVKTSSPPGRAMVSDANVLNDYNHRELTPECGR